MIILRRIWPYLAIAALFAVSLLFARRIGGLEKAIQTQAATIQKRKDVQDAGDATPTDRADVVDRMRNGDF